MVVIAGDHNHTHIWGSVGHFHVPVLNKPLGDLISFVSSSDARTYAQVPAEVPLQPPEDPPGDPAEIPDLDIAIPDIIRNPVGKYMINKNICYAKSMVF